VLKTENCFLKVVDVDRCLLGLRNHQGRCRGEKKIPIAYVTDSLCEAARIEQALHQHNLKTQSAVLRKAESKGGHITLVRKE
jgi:hypothetical protein